ncbi:unnamed protein product [marine sediment metagenome]|uniref:Uncharacterized protein n=1 Tax=marine sediment metagenome TaxID=412755 RepID=X1CYE8_9ZZZZ
MNILSGGAKVMIFHFGHLVSLIPREINKMHMPRIRRVEQST